MNGLGLKTLTTKGSNNQRSYKLPILDPLPVPFLVPASSLFPYLPTPLLLATLVWIKTSNNKHSFQNQTGPGGQTVKIENRDVNRFFKHKEPNFLLIL